MWFFVCHGIASGLIGGGALNFFQVGVCGPDFQSVGLANWHLPLKGGACELKISQFVGLWAENFQIWGLVSWKFPNLGAWELKFGQNWGCRGKNFKIFWKGVLWTDSFAWNGTLVLERCEKGVFKAAHPHTPFLGQCPPPPALSLRFYTSVAELLRKIELDLDITYQYDLILKTVFLFYRQFNLKWTITDYVFHSWHYCKQNELDFIRNFVKKKQINYIIVNVEILHWINSKLVEWFGFSNLSTPKILSLLNLWQHVCKLKSVKYFDLAELYPHLLIWLIWGP